uniref:E3 ubiquitin/ISG15 ligase TRIM25-like n=1 Tax=Erpetoichthys calabaricus TaxID=27687 RepID=A0A8C4SUI4_ERPCA
MAEAQFFVSQDEFTCSVCLEILSDPVTIPCGHSFCLKCLTDCWDQSQECSCPQCRETFMPRPELRRSTVLNEVIKKLKKTAISPRPLPQPQNYASPGDVECDFCTVNKFRAVKSCLTCMASYCQTHLQLHFEIAAWKDHKLVDPDGNLKEKLCVKHLKSLEIFCKTDETCVCLMCVVTGHKNHEIVELEMEREEKEISFAREVEENEKSFNDLINYIMETHSKLTARIRKQEKREMKKAEGVLEQLGKEIQELKRRDAELQKLSDTKDHIRFLQVRATLHRKSDQTGVWDLRTFIEKIQKIQIVFKTDLRLTDGIKKVIRKETEAKYPDHPDRFDWWPQVLCREALTGTRCYWEVEWRGDEMLIGVAYEGMGRKGDGEEFCLGFNDKSWSLWWSHSHYNVCHNSQKTVIGAPYSPRIGVYLDWPAGSLSFYSISHTMTLLHRFNTSFIEPLYPGCYLGCKSTYFPPVT